MRQQARVVIIGGGIAGCSALYHLTKEGWSDVMLVERDELTSGTTWHSAAQVTQFGGNQTFVALKRHSINLYRELAADADFPINYHITGGMRLGYNQDQMDIYKHYIAMAKGVGVDFELIDADEVGRRHPLMQTDNILGAWWDPLDGDIDPSQLTQALARKAREAGAEISRFNPVEALTQKPDDSWIVHTKNGDIDAEIIVNAGGYRVNEIGAMMGVEHPVISMEHMYFLTDPIAELEAMDVRVPIIRDPGDDFYSRQEKNGLLVGVYEQSCKTFGMDGIDPNFTMSLCPNDLDRCLDNMDGIFQRLPCLTETGIHTVVNGPITYSADGMPLVGPIPGKRNAFCIIGLRAGIGEGGGHGKLLAEHIVHGECEWDAWFLDPRRFTSHANTEFTMLKSIEDYQLEFHYHMPHEERPAGRLAKTTPLYPVLHDLGAQFGVVNGWERPMFYKPDADFVDIPSYRYTPTREVVGAEITHLQHHVGLMEVNGFARFEITGAGAFDFLHRMICGAMPARNGKVTLAYMLTEKGSILSEITIARLADDRFMVGSAAAAEWHDRDWLEWHCPRDGSVVITNMTNSHTILVLAGPKSRALLAGLALRDDVSADGLPWLTAKPVTIGHARALAMAVSFSGELAFELHIANEALYLAYKLITEAGVAFNLRPFGLYAAESMRLEKGFGHWKTDFIYEHTPFESGLDRFVRMTKPDFIGKDALIVRHKEGARFEQRLMAVDADHAPAHAGDPIYADGVQWGSVTSGGWGHRVGKNIVLAHVKTGAPRTGLSVGILGEEYALTDQVGAFYDPDFELVRGT